MKTSLKNFGFTRKSGTLMPVSSLPCVYGIGSFGKSAYKFIELFRTIKEKFPKAKIIAEDLGFITDDVRMLLADTDFPGMKMLQFAFFDDDSEYLPRTYTTDNCVAYPGSHDADCVRTWCKNLSGDTLKCFNRE